MPMGWQKYVMATKSSSRRRPSAARKSEPSTVSQKKEGHAENEQVRTRTSPQTNRQKMKKPEFSIKNHTASCSNFSDQE
jgi:hypothetical protein